MRAKEFVIESLLLELNMSPTFLRQLVSNIDARAGMEFELVIPNNISNDEDQEPDYSSDERVETIDQITNFFDDRNFNSGKDVSKMEDKLRERFNDWMYSDKADAEFRDNDEELVTNYIKSEYEGETDEDIYSRIEDALENHNKLYVAALDQYREEVNKRDNSEYEQEFLLSQEGISRLRDVPDNFPNISWPYWGLSEPSIDLEEVASEFGSSIGRQIKYSPRYHGVSRDARDVGSKTHYIVEPDSTIESDDGEEGLEFVSPPLPIGEMLSDLRKVSEWAKDFGAYTNDSTGLHINVSVEGFDKEKLDYVKLALLLGDDWVADQFGRLGNTFAKSAMEIIKKRVSDHPEDAEVLLAKMKTGLGQIATKVIHSGETNKYTSINTQEGWIEFRSPGGNWLSDDLAKVENTLLRMVVALDAACDPNKYRQDYLKKLYGILNIKPGNDPLSYFTRYSAGDLPKAALKSFIKQVQLVRTINKQPMSGIEYWWEVQPKGLFTSIEVVAKTKEEAINKAHSGSWEDLPINTFNATVLRKYEPDTSRVDPSNAQRPAIQNTSPTGRQFTGTWLVIDDIGQELYRFSGIGNSQADANRIAGSWVRANNYTAPVEVVPEMR